MMKRLVYLILCSVMIFSLFHSVASASDSTPVIALTHTPLYGELSAFEGVVFTEDGSCFDASDYRIALYLQLEEYGSYWVKPTYVMPYADIGSDGSFSIRYATGGYDDEAVIIHIMLIPSSFTPGADFSSTRAKALDYIKVTRTPLGQVTVSPGRSVPPDADFVPKSSGVRADSRRLAVNVGFYTDGSVPGSRLSAEHITGILSRLTDYADTVRFYGSAGELEKAYHIASDLGLSVIGTAWLSGDEVADREELDALISHCNCGLVRVACVGSETLLRGDLSVQELISDIQYVRERITDNSIPVTTADSADILMAQPSLIKACDIIMPNCYPYWAGSSIENAAGSTAETVNALKARAAGKEILVSETGWPSAGQVIGEACPGEAEAARYFEELRDWSISSGIPVLWFDAVDEPWKAAAEGESGAHWGFMTPELNLKNAYAGTDFFCSVYGSAGLANFVRINKYVPGRFYDVAENMWFSGCVADAYEYGLMQGTSADTFVPSGHITVAQTITLACNIHDTFYGLSSSHPGEDHWYDGYVSHAIDEGIISRNQFTDFDRPATRAEVALVLAFALPDTLFAPVKTGVSFSDVSPEDDYYDCIYMLSRAGVINGYPDGRFAPQQFITRAETAAIAVMLCAPEGRDRIRT